ncbi:uncharacterized protein V1516DRAFT_661890 [Lipomyces oligophaga]|uniref:uncharacterized protein n=1 Tax=Lipomyces oligophaga TaxID=45792 RepID=UPI0034CDD9B1
MVTSSTEATHRRALCDVLAYSLLRNDESTARRALALLLRSRAPAPRHPSHAKHHNGTTAEIISPLWTQMMELLNTSPREQRKLREWLLLSTGAYLKIPDRRIAQSQVRIRVHNQASTLYLGAICANDIAHGRIDEMVDRLEELLLEFPFSEDPGLHAYLGMGLMSIGRKSEAQKALDRSRILGWDVPSIVAADSGQPLKSENYDDSDMEMLNF